MKNSRKGSFTLDESGHASINIATLSDRNTESSENIVFHIKPEASEFSKQVDSYEMPIFDTSRDYGEISYFNDVGSFDFNSSKSFALVSTSNLARINGSRNADYIDISRGVNNVYTMDGNDIVNVSGGASYLHTGYGVDKLIVDIDEIKKNNGSIDWSDFKHGIDSLVLTSNDFSEALTLTSFEDFEKFNDVLNEASIAVKQDYNFKEIKVNSLRLKGLEVQLSDIIDFKEFSKFADCGSFSLKFIPDRRSTGAAYFNSDSKKIIRFNKSHDMILDADSSSIGIDYDSSWFAKQVNGGIELEALYENVISEIRLHGVGNVDILLEGRSSRSQHTNAIVYELEFPPMNSKNMEQIELAAVSPFSIDWESHKLNKFLPKLDSSINWNKESDSWLFKEEFAVDIDRLLL